MVREDELKRLLLAGFMLKECALQMKMSYGTLRQYAGQPAFLQGLKELSLTVYENVDRELARSKDNITERLEKLSEDALEMMFDTAKALPAGMPKIKALQDLMDRDGRISRQKKVEAKQEHEFVNPLFLVHAAGVAREMDRKELSRTTGGADGGEDRGTVTGQRGEDGDAGPGG